MKRNIILIVMDVARASIKNLSTRFEKSNKQLISIRSKDKKYIWGSEGRDESYDLKSDIP